MKVDNLAAAYDAKKTLDNLKEMRQAVVDGKCGDLCLSISKGDGLTQAPLSQDRMLMFLDMLIDEATDVLLGLGVEL